MSRKSIMFFIATALMLSVLAGCSQSDTDAGSDADAQNASDAPDALIAHDYTYFAGRQVGLPIGSVFDTVVPDIVHAEPAFYADLSTGVADVRNGKIAGYIQDLSTIRLMVQETGNEDLSYVELPEELFVTPMGAISAYQDIIDRFNIFLAAIEADGTLDDMQRRWLLTPPDMNAPMPEPPSTGENGTLNIAFLGVTPPFSYMGAGNELKGYCVELGYRFAAHEGMKMKYSTIGVDAFMAYTVSGRTDLLIDCISITEERKQSVLFTDPFYIDGAAIVVLRSLVDGAVDPSASGGSEGEGGSEAAGSDFVAWFKRGIERNLITDNRWQLITSGLGVTLTISFLAQVFGTAFGGLVCFILTRKKRPARLVGDLYCGLINGTPVVVLLMITYYIIFGNSAISNVLVAVAAFTLVVGSSVAQTLKGAIDTVDPVEIEAARSIGFSAVRAFWTITLPQAVRRAMPSYTKGFVELVKGTAVVGYIAIQDLTRAGDIIRSRTYDAYFPLLFVALIYLAVTTLCVQLFKIVINRLNRGGTVQ